jgi:uncharacterized protein (TIGR03083 family)
VEIAEHIDALHRQGDLLADAAERAGLDAAVPPCAPWRVKDLLRHTGYIHRWAARHITECPGRVIDGPPETEILRGGAADAELVAWFRAGHAALVKTLSTADPALECATFMDAPSPLAFWARRQAHETAIHRADAESASGALPDYAPDFATDGIDELIMGFGQRRKYRPSAEPEGGLQVRTTDTGAAWQIGAEAGRIQACRKPAERAGADSVGSADGTMTGTASGMVTGPASGMVTGMATGPASGTVTGPASGVYLFLWNRCDAAQAGITITGDVGFLAAWQSSVRVRWG